MVWRRPSNPLRGPLVLGTGRIYTFDPNGQCEEYGDEASAEILRNVGFVWTGETKEPPPVPPEPSEPAVKKPRKATTRKTPKKKTE